MLRCRMLIWQNRMVGAPRFELGTPSPPDWCANRAALRSVMRRTIGVGMGRGNGPPAAARAGGRACAPANSGDTRGARLQFLPARAILTRDEDEIFTEVFRALRCRKNSSWAGLARPVPAIHVLLADSGQERHGRPHTRRIPRA